MTSRHYLTSSDLALDTEAVKRSFASHVEYTLAKDEYSATLRDFYRAISFAVRDRLCDRWNVSAQRAYKAGARRVYYLSLEYLIGRILGNAMLNLGVGAEARAALGDLNI